MKRPTDQDWRDFYTPNNFLDDATWDLAEVVVHNTEAVLDEIRNDVESLDDSEAMEYFEIFQFNYEFLSQKKIKAAADVVSAARASLLAAQENHEVSDARSVTVYGEWDGYLQRAQLLCSEVDAILNPRGQFMLRRFSPSRQLNFTGLTPSQFLERRANMQEHILKLRDEANVHAFRQGDVSLIRLLREMCQVVFKLDAAVSTQKTIEDELQKRVVQLNHHQKAYRESMYALIRELNDIGKAGQFALLHFYNKIRSVHKAVKLEV